MTDPAHERTQRLNPRSGTFIKQVEDTAEEVRQHAHHATAHTINGDYPRARGEAAQAERAARRLKELLKPGGQAGPPALAQER